MFALACWLAPSLGIPTGAALAAPRIVNGVVTHDYPAVAALLRGFGSLDDARHGCSGTLIGCSTVLTAAHCIAGKHPSRIWTYFQHAGIFTSAELISHPDYTTGSGGTFPLFDVGVIKLHHPVTGIEPLAWNDSIDPEPFIPYPGRLVGFGQTTGGAGNFGIKRTGLVTTANCDAPQIPNNAGNDELVCWNFDAPIGPPGEDSNTCNGDSGGPLLADLGTGPMIVGVTSGGTVTPCTEGDQAYDANVYAWRAFIADALGDDATSDCGNLSVVGSDGVSVTELFDEVDAAVDEASPSLTLRIPTGTAEARFALNGEDFVSLDLDLYVKQGHGAGPESFDCKASGTSKYAACRFASPAAGLWSVFLDNPTGQGSYQLTTSLFDPRAPLCGDGILGGEELCDGDDDELCPNVCREDCTCGPPCSTNDVTVRILRVSPSRVLVRLIVDQLENAPAWVDVDPRDGFVLKIETDDSTVVMELPAGDPGWTLTKPPRRRYRWTGSKDGIRKVQALDRARAERWEIKVVAGAVDGVEQLLGTTNLGVRLRFGDQCGEAKTNFARTS